MSVLGIQKHPDAKFPKATWIAAGLEVQDHLKKDLHILQPPLKPTEDHLCSSMTWPEAPSTQADWVSQLG